MEVCLINFNKGEDDDGCLKSLQYSEMESNCVRKFTERLIRVYLKGSENGGVVTIAVQDGYLCLWYP
jgi:hypothetical protein